MIALKYPEREGCLKFSMLRNFYSSYVSRSGDGGSRVTAASTSVSVIHKFLRIKIYLCETQRRFYHSSNYHGKSSSSASINLHLPAQQPLLASRARTFVAHVELNLCVTQQQSYSSSVLRPASLPNVGLGGREF